MTGAEITTTLCLLRIVKELKGLTDAVIYISEQGFGESKENSEVCRIIRDAFTYPPEEEVIEILKYKRQGSDD